MTATASIVATLPVKQASCSIAQQLDHQLTAIS
jgi:hypothetical protein